MRPALPASDYYGGSAPTQRHQQTLPSQPQRGEGSPGGFPRSLPFDRRDRRPAFPLRACHDDNAVTRRGTPRPPNRQHRDRVARKISGFSRTAKPAQIHRVRADASLAGVQTLVHLRFAAPSCLPHPRSPVVPPRHGVVRAACHPHPQLRDQAALSFHQAAAAAQRRGLSPRSNPTAPRGAPSRPRRARPRAPGDRDRHRRCRGPSR